MLTDRERKLLREQPPEIIEALFESLRKENDELRHIVKEIEAEKLKKDQQSLNIEEQLKTLRKKIFGRSKENRVEASDRPRDKSQQDVLLFSQSAFQVLKTEMALLILKRTDCLKLLLYMSFQMRI
jgi:hypothetical protein